MTFVTFSIGRRYIAAAIFSGQKLEFSEVRSFQANTERAKNTVTAFINHIIQQFNIGSAGLEDIPESLQTRMAVLSRLSEQVLRDTGIPVAKATETELFDAYGEPPLRSRAALREVALAMFPQLKTESTQKERLDAAILGLHLQTEKLLSVASEALG
ncbi:MAG TPA: hypothetical protein VKY85_14435 [Candidatus Angelobacter sp.]|nr:hypothetical protein [Candidatus Angelobacter sp.]